MTFIRIFVTVESNYERDLFTGQRFISDKELIDINFVAI